MPKPETINGESTEFHLDAEGRPITGSRWRHHSGRVYVVLMVTNTETTRPERFPMTVVYQNTANGTRWSRPMEDFLTNDRFTPVN